MNKEQYERQRQFLNKYRDWLHPDFTAGHDEELDHAKEFILSLHREVDEILDELPWKMHREYPDHDLIKSNVAEEIIDCIKYLFNLAILYNVSYDELTEEFDVKSSVVEDRWRQEHEHVELKGPIALIDLDGVLNEYPKPFLDFVYDRSGLRFSDMTEIDSVDPLLKRQMKHLYRQSGVKRTLTPITDSVLACQILDHAGYDVVIMSQRPYETYQRIYGDTIYWLRAHHVPYKRLVFVPGKGHKLLLSPWKDKIAFAVDDDPEVVRSLRGLGLKVYRLGEEITFSNDNRIDSMLHIQEVKDAAGKETAHAR